MRTTSSITARSWLTTALVAIQVWGPFVGQAKAALLTIGDSPIVASSAVSPNLMLTLSVEWPTGVVAAYNDNANTTTGFECPGRTDDTATGTTINNIGRCYFDAREYLGYFDPKKCYLYDAVNEYFYPSSLATGANSHTCSASWSGNYMNWATSHSLDVFRFTMTGGDRVIDTATTTVVEKSYHSGDGGHNQFPIKRVRDTVSGGGTIPAVPPNTVTPYAYSTLFARVTNGGTAIEKTGVANSRGRVVQFSDTANFSTNLQTFLVRVKVCDATVGRESNCTQYGTSWKPTGLIQNNADRMRFGVMGYLNDSAKERPGGVLRSPLKFVGRNEMIPNGTPTANASPEINTDGTHISNPDPAYATASGVTNSGVIHYLNQFGKTSQSYKSWDTLGEMVYETTRYVRNLPASAQYTAGMTTTMADGFPVITNWDSKDQSQAQNRAIQYSCQKTFFVGIADTNAWCDVTVPGNTLTPDSCGAKNSAYSGSDSQINVTTLGNAIGAAEGRGNLGATFASTGRDNTYHGASIAYWANSTDMLADDASKPWTKGNQTAQSYWVDVRETGSDGPTGTQMWLAAKYGGYNNTGATPGTLKTAPTATVDFDKDGDGTPDNYYTGERPDKMHKALKSVFQNVLDVTYAGAGASVSTQSLSAGGSSFQVRYSSIDWTGDVMGNTLTLSVDNPATPADEGGVPTETNVWRASTKLNTLASGTGWDTARKIVTYNGTVGVPFRASGTPALTATQLGYLGSTSSERTNLINYTRGERTNEGSTFRTRTGLLGDIINSKATYVGAPPERYNEATHPGFNAFRTATAVASRTPMIYVGANDGMMHAINASTSTSDGGNEKFAYIPSFVLSGPSVPANPNADGLAARASLGNFTHKYYVDQTPMVRSVNFAHTGVAPSAGFSASADWRTLLVGGMNKGGRGYYALDVTNPAQWTDEATVAGKVLWEFTDADMGYSYGRPVIVYTKKYGWVVIVTSGYNNVHGAAANRGKGFLYVLNAATGALLEKIDTGVGDATTPSGLAQVNAFVQDFREMTVDYVYGGDLLGNLWRFDLTQPAGTAGSYPAPLKFATLAHGGVPQPVTTEPKIEIGRDRVSRWLFIGTGQLMSDADVPSTQVQTLYAFRDGTVSTPNVTGSFPLTRSSLAQMAGPVAGVTPTADGWYMDLTLNPGTAGSPAERVVNTPTANEGFIGWVTQKPTDDPCAPGVVSYAYLLEYATGKTRLIDSSGNWTASYQAPVASGFFLEWTFMRSDGRMRGILSASSGGTLGGVSSGDLEKPPQNLGTAPGTPARLQWREIVR